MEQGCNCIKVRNGAAMLMGVLWLAFQAQPLVGVSFSTMLGDFLGMRDLFGAGLFAGWLVLLVCGVIHMSMGIRAAIEDGDSRPWAPSAAGIFLSIGLMCFGVYFSEPVLVKGIYLTILAGCYGNLVLYSTARKRRASILARIQATNEWAHAQRVSMEDQLRAALERIGAERDALLLSNAMFARLLSELRSPIENEALLQRIIDGHVVR